VWSNRPLTENLAAVFQRRQMESYRAGLRGVPLGSARYAGLDDIAAFMNADIDEEKLHDLVWGFLCVEFPRDTVLADRPADEIAFEFGCPRLLVAEQRLAKLRLADNRWIWTISKDVAPNTLPDPAVFHHLASGRQTAVGDCLDEAARRLKSGGLLVTGYRNRQQAGQSLNVKSTIPPERLLAAMLFPLSEQDLSRIANAVLYPPETEE
jgi:CRISPR-associated protein Csx17